MDSFTSLHGNMLEKHNCQIKISTPTPFWLYNLWCLFSGCNNNNKHFGNRRWKATKRQPHSSHKIYLMKLINKLWYKSWTVSGSKPPTLSVLLLQYMLLLLLLLMLRLLLLLLLLVCCCCSSNIFIKSSKLLAVACDADKRAWSAAVAADVAAGPTSQPAIAAHINEQMSISRQSFCNFWVF